MAVGNQDFARFNDSWPRTAEFGLLRRENQ